LLRGPQLFSGYYKQVRLEVLAQLLLLLVVVVVALVLCSYHSFCLCTLRLTVVMPESGSRGWSELLLHTACARVATTRSADAEQPH
jgi:hypothetical protein